MTKRTAAFAAALLAVSAGAATAQPVAVTWVEAPSAADVAAAWPAKVRAAGTGGMANLSCTIGRDGRPHDCAVLG